MCDCSIYLYVEFTVQLYKTDISKMSGSKYETNEKKNIGGNVLIK